MKLLPIHNKILEYLDKHGPVNTFRLSRDFGIDRAGLISVVKKLTKEGLTKFKSGVVTKGDKKTLVDQKITETKEVKEEKPSSKLISSITPKKSKILKERYSDLEKVKVKIQRSKDNWLKKEEELKKEIEELQTQKDSIAQRLKKEKLLLYQVRKEKRETEKNLVEWEKSLKQREESIQKREKSVSNSLKRLKRKKKRVSKAKFLKKDINKLEASLEGLKKKVSIEKRKLKKLNEEETKLKAIPKKVKKLKKKKIKPILKPKIEKHVEKSSISKIETEKPKLIAEDLLQLAVEREENVYNQFHDLIEQEIKLLKEKRIYRAREIHLRIKDMISEVRDFDLKKKIIQDWNRIREFG